MPPKTQAFRSVFCLATGTESLGSGTPLPACYKSTSTAPVSMHSDCGQTLAVREDYCCNETVRGWRRLLLDDVQ